MINYFKRRKIKKQVRGLEGKILTHLKDHFKDLYENHLHWQLDSVSIGLQDNLIQLLHKSNEPGYIEANRIRHNKNFKIRGLRIWNRVNSAYEDFEVLIYGNCIQFIDIKYDKDLFKEYDLGKIQIGAIETEDLVLINEDREKLLKVLEGLSPEERDKLEIEDTFEIEIDFRKFYPIIDLEDGSFIAVDTSKQVYRLIHDHENPIKRIDKTVGAFVKKYNGDKESLMELLDE